MAWVSPRTWTSGQLVLASQLNVDIRDNMNTTAAATMTGQGDLLIATAANTPSRLAKDANATRYLANTGTNNNPQWNQVALATGVSGTLPVGNGGSGATTLTANGVLVGNGTSAVSAVDMSTKGHIIIGDGSGNPQTLSLGTNGQVLTADSSEATGVKWTSAATGTPEGTVILSTGESGGTKFLREDGDGT